jgi:hypothetical protein
MSGLVLHIQSISFNSLYDLIYIDIEQNVLYQRKIRGYHLLAR